MAAGAGLWMTGSSLVRELSRSLTSGLSLTREQVFNPDVLTTRILVDVLHVMLACLPIAVAVMVVALASPLLVGGWLFSAKAFTPNFMKLNPITGIANMFSTNSLVELVKAIGKSIVVGVVAYMVISRQQQEAIGLMVEPLHTGSTHVMNMLGFSFIVIVGSLGFIALIDAPYQMWHYANKLKMTRQEVIQESKESDGNPQIKGKIRQLQREMAKAGRARRASWPRVPTQSRPRSASWQKSTASPSWKHRRWRVPCTSIPRSAMKSRRACTPPWRKCWPMCTRSRPIVQACDTRTVRPSSMCRTIWTH
jgi:flagellar biosynthesis protein FlhB